MLHIIQNVFLLLMFNGLLAWNILLAVRYRNLKRGGKQTTAQIKNMQSSFGYASITVTWRADDGKLREQALQFSSFRAVKNEVEIYYDDTRAMLVGHTYFYVWILISAFVSALAFIGFLLPFF